MYQNSNVEMFQNKNVEVYQSNNVAMFQNKSVEMYQNSNVQSNAITYSGAKSATMSYESILKLFMIK